MFETVEARKDVNMFLLYNVSCHEEFVKYNVIVMGRSQPGCTRACVLHVDMVCFD